MLTHSLAVIIVIAVVFAVAKKFRLNTELCLLLGALGAVLAHVILPMGEDPRSALPFTETTSCPSVAAVFLARNVTTPFLEMDAEDGKPFSAPVHWYADEETDHPEAPSGKSAPS